MTAEHLPWLTITIVLPVVGAMAVLLVPRGADRLMRTLALAFTSATATLAAGLVVAFPGGSEGFEVADPPSPWIPEYGIYYRVGLDGISLWLFVLTAFLSVIGVLASWTSVTERLKAYYSCLLLIETGMLGVFAALDLVLFYVFWEAMLIPMCVVIGVWGSERRVYAALKFLCFTLSGGVLMLAGILFLYFSLPAVERTFDITALLASAPRLDPARQSALFLLFGAAFAVKVPLVPLHTWLPDAHTEAPTAGSILLAGVLLKMGGYGFLRICLGLFPVAAQEYAPLMMWLAVVGILYGGAAAMWQRDVKRLIAYSSISHMGFVMLGIFAFNTVGSQAAVLQMVNHGLSTGGLFLLVGMLYERRHSRMIDDYGGLWEETPVLARVFLVLALSSIGLPGLNGFVSEFLALMATFISAHGQAVVWTALGASGVIVSACYMLWMVKRVLYGRPRRKHDAPLPDLRPVDVAAVIALLVPIVWLGVYPSPVLRQMEPPSAAAMDRLATHTGIVSIGTWVGPAGEAGPNGDALMPEARPLGGDEAEPGGDAP